jgi:Holliday junction resolvasome RuvABC endonuclease subunit
VAAQPSLKLSLKHDLVEFDVGSKQLDCHRRVLVGVAATVDLAEISIAEFVLLSDDVPAASERYLLSWSHLTIVTGALRVIGAHVRASDRRFLAGLAVVDDDRLVRGVSLPAPADSDIGRQLEELYVLARDFVNEFEPEELALKVTEARAKSALAVAHRAEGCILAAAGDKGVPVTLWFGASLRTPSGLESHSSVQQRVEALCSELSQMPTENEVAQAAAAARASIKRS